MKTWAAALVMAGSLFGQADEDTEMRSALTSSLMSLRSRDGTDQRQAVEELTVRILSVPEAGQRKGAALAVFARRLATTLAGRDWNRALASRLAANVAGALRSAGMGTAEFHEHITGFRASLTAVGVNPISAGRLAEDLLALGEGMRGPQDLPALPPR